MVFLGQLCDCLQSEVYDTPPLIASVNAPSGPVLGFDLRVHYADFTTNLSQFAKLQWQHNRHIEMLSIFTRRVV